MRPWELWDTPTKNGVVAKASTTMRARIVLAPPVRAEEGRGGLSGSYDWAHRNSRRAAQQTVPLVTLSLVTRRRRLLRYGLSITSMSTSTSLGALRNTTRSSLHRGRGD